MGSIFDETRDDLADSAARVFTEGRSWALRRDVLEVLARADGRLMAAAEDFHAAGKAKAAVSKPSGGVAVVDMTGVITPELTFMAWLMGASGGLNDTVASLRAAFADSEVKAVVLNVDSPGGLVDGVPEAAAQIREMRAAHPMKPMCAVANCQIASAAYWLAAQAHEIVVTPSGEVGSVGVYQVHQDQSAALEGAGVKTTVISAGRYKTEGNPYEPLSAEAIDATQQSINDFYAMFTADVGAGRGQAADPQDVQDGTAFGGGRSFTAKRAVKQGLADRVATLGETVGRLQSGRARVKQMDTGACEFVWDEDLAPEGRRASRVYTPEEKERLLGVLASR